MKLICILLLTFAPLLNAQVKQSVPIIYVDESYPPYSYLQNSKLKGIYPSLLEQIETNNPNLNFDVKAVHWEAAIQQLKNAKSGAILGVYKDVKGHEFITRYSQPVFTEHVVLVCAKHHKTNSLQTWPSDFKGKLVANVEGYSGWLRNNVRSNLNTQFVNFLEVPDVSTAITMVVKGNIDCALSEKLVFDTVLHELADKGLYIVEEDINPVIVANVASETTHLGYINRAENCRDEIYCHLSELIEQELTTLKKSGAYEKLLKETDPRLRLK